MENPKSMANHVYVEDLIDFDSYSLQSATFQMAVSYWMNGIISTILVIIGLIGNISMMISFLFTSNGIKSCQTRRQAFSYYLITFSIWNTGLLLATIPFNCIPALLSSNSTDPSPETLHFSSVSYLVGYLIGNCCVTADSWLAVVVTVERYLAVTKPLRIRLSSPRRRAKWICAIVSVLAVIYNLPLLFEFTLHTAGYDQSSDGNGTSMGNDPITLALSPMRDNVLYQFLYRVVAHFLFVSVLPFTLVLLLTIKIVCVVRESDRNRSRFRKPLPNTENRSIGSSPLTLSLSNARTQISTKNRQADVLLTLIAAKFLLFYTLPVAINIMEMAVDHRIFESEHSEAAKILFILVDLSNLLIVLDGATNSFFYFSWKNRFRSSPFGGWSMSRRSAVMMMESNCLGHAENRNDNGPCDGTGWRRRSAVELARASFSLRPPGPPREGNSCFELCSVGTPMTLLVPSVDFGEDRT